MGSKEDPCLVGFSRRTFMIIKEHYLLIFLIIDHKMCITIGHTEKHILLIQYHRLIFSFKLPRFLNKDLEKLGYKFGT